MTFGTRLARALLLLAASLPGALAGADDARAPVPDSGARAGAVSELRKEHREGLESKSPEVRRALARTLIDRAAGADVGPAKRYVLLEQAVALAEGVRDVRLALDAVAALSTAFRLESAPRGLAALDAITRSTKETGVLAEAASAAVELAGAALAADDPGSAARALGAAKTLAKAAKLGGLAARAAELVPLVDAFRRAAAAAVAARKALATTPDEPAANEALGRFLAFGRGRWEEGVPHLAKSSDAVLAGLAAAEVERRDDAGARRALADGWWDFAQREKDPLARARALARAATVYERAPSGEAEDRAAQAKLRLEALTYRAFDRGIALTKDFSKDGPVSLALAILRGAIAERRIERSGSGWRTQLPRFPDVTFGRGEEYLWRLETNQGVITVRFFADTAPKHVANFLYLTELGYFDGLGFHRVVPGFMAQGGCPTGSGSGGPGYGFAGEFGTGPGHDKPGLLSMANTGAPESDGSQFFLTFRAAKELDGKHTVFGEVVEGLDVLKKLESLGTPEPGRPKEPIRIVRATVAVR